jgi:ankyrin repeat protein
VPSSICKALNELPVTLDDTYTRALECIPQEKWQHAHRLFQCLIAAIRPLRVEELAEIFAIEFDSKAGHRLVEGWRPVDAEYEVLSACSSLISVVNVKDSKIVQFSHFSVKEFLTSDRLASSNVRTVSQYYVALGSAHRILARACLTVLLQLDEKTDKTRLGTFPLAFYSAEHWVDHAKFGEVTQDIQDVIIRLFDPKKSHLDAWTWIHNVEGWSHRTIDRLEERPPLLSGTALYFAAYCGFSWLAKHIITVHAEDVNGKSAGDKYCRIPLHAAYRGHRAAVEVSYSDGTEVKREIEDGSRIERHDEHLEVMRLLLENGADVHARDQDKDTVSHLAAADGDVEALQVLLEYKAAINARGYQNWTPLHNASFSGRIQAVELLLKYKADVNVQDSDDNTPLILASRYASVEVVRLLLKYEADVGIRDRYGKTAFQAATRRRGHEIAPLLLEHGAEEEEDGSESDYSADFSGSE